MRSYIYYHWYDEWESYDKDLKHHSNISNCLLSNTKYEDIKHFSRSQLCLASSNVPDILFSLYLKHICVWGMFMMVCVEVVSSETSDLRWQLWVIFCKIWRQIWWHTAADHIWSILHSSVPLSHTDNADIFICPTIQDTQHMVTHRGRFENIRKIEKPFSYEQNFSPSKIRKEIFVTFMFY